MKLLLLTIAAIGAPLLLSIGALYLICCGIGAIVHACQYSMPRSF